jgi:hypothetical protein
VIAHASAPNVDVRLAGARTTGRAVERLSDDQLLALFDDCSRGWGATQRVEVDGRAVFVKRVPVTALEHAHSLPTANLYGIPPYLNYPFGSPGTGVGRELSFALETTRWVEERVCTAFPILLHHRLVERTRSSAPGGDEFAGYSAYRGDDPSMNRYLAERAGAQCDLVLCFEHISHNAVDWITTHPGDVSRIVDDVRTTIAFLRDQGVVHFDVDLFNVLTDGDHAYLADYGLVLDSAFDLTDEERSFLDRNRHFDDGNLILSVGHQLYWNYRATSDDVRQRIDAELALGGLTFEASVRRLLDGVDVLERCGLLVTDPRLRELLTTYRPVIDYMHEFFTAGRADWSPETTIDDGLLAELLDQAH